MSKSPHNSKISSSNAAWAVIMEGVTGSRVEAHRLRHLLSRALRLIENASSDQKEHFYQMAGDLIVSIPRRLDILETILDKTSYALSIMGQDFLRSRLPLQERSQIQESVEQVDRLQKESAKRVARLWLDKHD